MNLPVSTALRGAVVAVVAVTLMSACTLGDKTVPQSDVEDDVSAQLNKQTGQDNDASCEDDLPAEQDAAVDCTWDTDDGQEIPVVVTVTNIDGEEVAYKIEPQKSPDSGDSSGDSSGETGTPVGQSALEQKIQQGMEQQVGKSYPVTCEGDLEGNAGATQRCVWNAEDGSTLGIDVELTGYKDGVPQIHFQADDKPTPAPKS